VTRSTGHFFETDQGGERGGSTTYLQPSGALHWRVDNGNDEPPKNASTYVFTMPYNRSTIRDIGLGPPTLGGVSRALAIQLIGAITMFSDLPAISPKPKKTASFSDQGNQKSPVGQ
jgi:hypothetical protein